MMQLHVDLRAIAFLEGEWCNQTCWQQESFTPGNNKAQADQASIKGQPSPCSCEAGRQSRAMQQAPDKTSTKQPSQSGLATGANICKQRLDCCPPHTGHYASSEVPQCCCKAPITSTPNRTRRSCFCNTASACTLTLVLPAGSNTDSDSDKHSSNPTQQDEQHSQLYCNASANPPKQPMLHASLSCRVCGVLITPQNAVRGQLQARSVLSICPGSQQLLAPLLLRLLSAGPATKPWPSPLAAEPATNTRRPP